MVLLGLEFYVTKLGYYVKDSHPAIISREDFEKTKELMAARAKGNNEGDRDKYQNRYPLTGTIVYGHCGNHLKDTLIIAAQWPSRFVGFARRI